MGNNYEMVFVILFGAIPFVVGIEEAIRKKNPAHLAFAMFGLIIGYFGYIHSTLTTELTDIIKNKESTFFRFDSPTAATLYMAAKVKGATGEIRHLSLSKGFGQDTTARNYFDAAVRELARTDKIKYFYLANFDVPSRKNRIESILRDYEARKTPPIERNFQPRQLRVHGGSAISMNFMVFTDEVIVVIPQAKDDATIVASRDRDVITAFRVFFDSQFDNEMVTVPYPSSDTVRCTFPKDMSVDQHSQ